MADSLHLKLALPEGKVFDEKIKALTSFSVEGEFVMLPDHCHILAALQMGRLIVEHLDGRKQLFAADEGFLEGGVDHVNVILRRCVEIKDLHESDVTRDLTSVTERLTAVSDTASAEWKTLDQNRCWFQLQLDLLKKPL